jgi:Collagen triple helix repeat (20 copies)
MIVAVVALIVALGGTGYAALTLPKRSVGKAQLKRNAVTSPKVRDGALLARDFAPGQLPAGERGPAGEPGPPGERGLTGATGEAGQDGADGTNGTDGATGSALLTGQASNLPNTISPVAGWAGVNEIGPFGTASDSDANSTTRSPARDLTLRDLSVKIQKDLPDGGLALFEVVAASPPLNAQFNDNGGGAVISCTVVGGAGNETTCSAAGPGTLPASQLIFMRITVSSSGVAADPVRANWGVSAEPAP